MTKAEYDALCPLLASAVTVTKFKGDHPLSVAAEPVEPTPPTKPQVVAVYDALRTLESDGTGYHGIVRKTGVALQYVKQIEAQIQRAAAKHAEA